MNRTDVRGTLVEMWETRPVRPRHGQQIAGVAAAIALRYDIDPVLVRVGFVVSAFSGVGAVLYIAGWLLLPPAKLTEDPAGDPAAPARRARPHLLVGLVIATLVSIGAILNTILGGDPGFVVGALVVAGLLFLLHRGRGTLGAAEQPTAPAGVAPVNLSKDPARTPPSWDPLGAAPFAWGLPEPGPVADPTPRRRSPLTLVTLALALLAGGVTGVVLLAAGVPASAGLPVLFGVPLAVLGTGLLAGAFTHAGRGLIPFALVLGVLTWAVVEAPLQRWEGWTGSVGWERGWDGREGRDDDDVRVVPTSAAAVVAEYRHDVGSLELDLRGVNLAVPAGAVTEPIRTELSVGLGSIEVWVPRNADVSVDATAGLGAVSFRDPRDGGQERFAGGPGAELRVTDDLGSDGVRSGRPLVLDIEAGMGSVEVHRG